MSVLDAKFSDIPFPLHNVQCLDSATLCLCLHCFVSLLDQTILEKFQISQNKCIRYCLALDNRAHISTKVRKSTNYSQKKESHNM